MRRDLLVLQAVLVMCVLCAMICITGRSSANPQSTVYCDSSDGEFEDLVRYSDGGAGELQCDHREL